MKKSLCVSFCRYFSLSAPAQLSIALSLALTASGCRMVFTSDDKVPGAGITSTDTTSVGDPIIGGGSPASAPVIGTGTGLTGNYMSFTSFNGSTLMATQVVGSRVDATIDFDWSAGDIPAGDVSKNHFAVNWTGKIEPKVTGIHTFYVEADSGVRLTVSNHSIVNQWAIGSDLSSVESKGKIHLTAGQKYDISLSYFELNTQGTVLLSWSAPGLVKEVIPQTQLYPSGSTVIVGPQPSPLPVVVVRPSPSPVVVVQPSPSPVVVVQPSPSPLPVIIVVRPSPSPVVVVQPSPSPVVVVQPSPSPVVVVQPSPSPLPVIIVVRPSPSPVVVVQPSPSPNPRTAAIPITLLASVHEFFGTDESASQVDTFFTPDLAAQLNVGDKQAFSVDGMFRLKDATTDHGVLFSMRHSGAGMDAANIDITVGADGATDRPGTVMAMVRSEAAGSAPAELISLVTVNDNTWHYFALTRDINGSVQLYIDDQRPVLAANQVSGPITTDMRYLGREKHWENDSGSQWWQPPAIKTLQGKMDSVSFVAAELQPSDIAVHFAAAKLRHSMDWSGGPCDNPPTLSLNGNASSFNASLVTSSVQAFSAQGGYGSLTWSFGGIGSVDANHRYSAPANTGSALIKVTDQCSKSVTASISIVPPADSCAGVSALLLNGNSSSFADNITGGNNKAYSVTGGKLPISISQVDGPGAFTGTIYTGPTAGGTAHIRASDACNQTITATIVVSSNVVVTNTNLIWKEFPSAILTGPNTHIDQNSGDANGLTWVFFDNYTWNYSGVANVDAGSTAAAKVYTGVLHQLDGWNDGPGMVAGTNFNFTALQSPWDRPVSGTPYPNLRTAYPGSWFSEHVSSTFYGQILADTAGTYNICANSIGWFKFYLDDVPNAPQDYLDSMQDPAAATNCQGTRSARTRAGENAFTPGTPKPFLQAAQCTHFPGGDWTDDRAFQPAACKDVQLSAGRHTVRMDTKIWHPSLYWSLQWTKPGSSTQEVIPSSHLFPAQLVPSDK